MFLKIFKNIGKGGYAAILLFLLASALFVCVIPLFFLLRESVPTMGFADVQECTFVLDAGHGGEDCGAIGQNGAYEKNLNFSITMELGRQLSDLGYRVIYTRTEDKLLYTDAENIKGQRKIFDLRNRVKIASSHENAVFISIHMNSFSDFKYAGLQVFYSPHNSESQQLALSVQEQVKEQLQKENRRTIREGKDIYLLENLTCPAVLIECGFLSNPEECEKLCEKEYQKQLCFAILCGIMEANEISER